MKHRYKYNVAVRFKCFIYLPVPLPFSTHTPGQPLQFPHVHRSPSFHVLPKKIETGLKHTYTNSYKLPLKLVLVSFRKMHTYFAFN